MNFRSFWIPKRLPNPPFGILLATLWPLFGLPRSLWGGHLAPKVSKGQLQTTPGSHFGGLGVPPDDIGTPFSQIWHP